MEEFLSCRGCGLVCSSDVPLGGLALSDDTERSPPIRGGRRGREFAGLGRSVVQL
jgi:hypothetical protein